MVNYLRYFIILATAAFFVSAPFAGQAETGSIATKPEAAAGSGAQGETVALICRSHDAEGVPVYTAIDLGEDGKAACPEGTVAAGREVFVEHVDGAASPRPLPK